MERYCIVYLFMQGLEARNKNILYCICIFVDAGFGGKKCEKLTSISFQPDAYVSLSSLDTSRDSNVTIVMSTKSAQGVILYQGFDQHIAVEIFRGRVRVSFDIGNYPVSTMFSYTTVNDGVLHTLELLMTGKNLTMRIDRGMARTIMNEGERRKLESSEPLHLGGVPPTVKDSAFKKWHIRNTHSFKGRFRLLVGGNTYSFKGRFRLLVGGNTYSFKGRFRLLVGATHTALKVCLDYW